MGTSRAGQRPTGPIGLRHSLRRLHRWAALPMFAFLFAIAATGTALQAIMIVYGDTGPRRAPGEPLWVLNLRDLAVTLHTGAFAGMPGVLFGIVCALALLLFSATGVWMYLDLYRHRAKQGRTGLWWRTRVGKDATMRSLHRWITPPVALFTALLSLSGASLGVYFAWDGMVPLPPPREAVTGALRPSAGPPPAAAGRAWHDVSLSVHKLSFLDVPGHLLGLLAGIALLVLSVSGAWMYLRLSSQRRKTGKTELFW